MSSQIPLYPPNHLSIFYTESVEHNSPCLAPRPSTIKEQHFSEVEAARIEAPQRVSTRSVYEVKWVIFYKVVPQLSDGL